MSKLLTLILLFLLLQTVFLFPVFGQSPTEEATFLPICESGQSDEECAIEKLNQGLLPEEVATESADSTVGSWISSIGQTAANIVAFFSGANNLQDSYVYDTPKKATDEQPTKESFLQLLVNTLAGSEGYYGTTLPKAEELPKEFKKPEGTGLQIGTTSIELFKSVNAEEKYYCNSYLPQEVCREDGTCEKIECPITGQPNQ